MILKNVHIAQVKGIFSYCLAVQKHVPAAAGLANLKNKPILHFILEPSQLAGFFFLFSLIIKRRLSGNAESISLTR